MKDLRSHTEVSQLPIQSLGRMQKLRLAPRNSWTVIMHLLGRGDKRKDLSSISKTEIPDFLIFIFWTSGFGIKVEWERDELEEVPFELNSSVLKFKSSSKAKNVTPGFSKSLTIFLGFTYIKKYHTASLSCGREFYCMVLIQFPTAAQKCHRQTKPTTEMNFSNIKRSSDCIDFRLGVEKNGV